MPLGARRSVVKNRGSRSTDSHRVEAQGDQAAVDPPAQRMLIQCLGEHRVRVGPKGQIGQVYNREFVHSRYCPPAWKYFPALRPS